VQFTLLEQKARGGESWQTKGRKAMSECDELREAVRQKEAEIAKRDEAVKSSLGLVHALREDLATCRASLAEKEQRIIELERRLRIPFGKLPCAQCGGPHDFDTSLPSVVWNKVIRAKGLPEYLCTTCIVREFVRAGEGFTATLWGEGFHGVPIEVSINNQNAKDAALIQEENNDYRVRIAEKAQEAAGNLELAKAVDGARTELASQLAAAQQEIERLKVCGQCGCTHGTSYELGRADAVAQERRRIRDAVEILPTYGDARTVLCDRAHVLAAIESKPADSTEGDAECK
jgi:hypothetical protein